MLGEGPATHLHGLYFPVGRDLEFDPVLESGDQQRLRSGGKAGFCFAVI